MDLSEKHDDLTLETAGVPGGAAIDQLASGLKNTAKSIAQRAKIKKAQKQLDSGGIGSLTPTQKDLLGISREPTAEERLRGVTYVNAGVPSYAAGGEPPLASGDTVDDSGIKRFIPYIIGVVVIGILIYFIVKKK